MSWGVKNTFFEASGVSLGGSGVSIGGVKILRDVVLMFLFIPFHWLKPRSGTWQAERRSTCSKLLQVVSGIETLQETNRNPTWGSWENHLQHMPFWGDMLVPWRVLHHEFCIYTFVSIYCINTQVHIAHNYVQLCPNYVLQSLYINLTLCEHYTVPIKITQHIGGFILFLGFVFFRWDRKKTSSPNGGENGDLGG